MRVERLRTLALRFVAGIVLGSGSSIALAQEARGLVLGFDGKPVHGAVVIATAATWGRELLTTADGRFEVLAEGPLTHLQVQVDGVVRDVPLTDGHARDVQITFADAPHTTLRCRIRTPDGAAADHVDVLCRDRHGKAIVSVTTDEQGAFTVRLGKGAHDLHVDPLGWQHVVAGPLAAGADQTLDLQLDPTRFFALQGRVLGANGPLVAAVVRAHHERGGVVATTTRKDGRYTLWVDRPVATLEVPGVDPIHRDGPFDAAATALDLDAHEHGLVLVVGRVLDATGEPLRGTMLFGVDQGGSPAKRRRPDGITDGDGWFRLRLPRRTPFVYAWCEGGDHGGWSAVPADRAPFEIRTN